jgi:hypothetical protein
MPKLAYKAAVPFGFTQDVFKKDQLLELLTRIFHASDALIFKLARQPIPPGIRLRRSRWRSGKARRPGALRGADVVFLLQASDNAENERIWQRPKGEKFS